MEIAVLGNLVGKGSHDDMGGIGSFVGCMRGVLEVVDDTDGSTVFPGHKLDDVQRLVGRVELRVVLALGRGLEMIGDNGCRERNDQRPDQHHDHHHGLPDVRRRDNLGRAQGGERDHREPKGARDGLVGRPLAVPRPPLVGVRVKGRVGCFCKVKDGGQPHNTEEKQKQEQDERRERRPERLHNLDQPPVVL